MKKIKIIALFGESGSGKDTLAKILVNSSNNINKIISCTTRPKREYEIDKKDYYFLTNEEFGEMVLNGQMLEATSFHNHFYGTPIYSLKENKINVGVFNIQGIECLLKDNRLEVIPIYIACEDYLRLERCLHREKNPDCEKICKRFLIDLEDFDDIPFEYYSHYNGVNIPKEWIIDDLIAKGFLTESD